MSLGAAEPLPAEEFEPRIAAQASEFGLSPPPDAVRRLARFLAELDLWRRRTNLTGPLSSLDLVSHALESCLGARLIRPASRVLDIGTGAGFPGVPIAIVRPDISMTLLEPRARRIEFLAHVVRVVPVENAKTVQKRLEVSSFEAEPFDYAVERAVGKLPSVVGRGSFLKAGGALLAWTTEPHELLRGLPVFSAGRIVAVPGSRRKVVAELLRSA